MTTQTSPSRSRRVGATIAAVGLLFMGGGVAAWQAPAAGAAELFSFELRGQSSGYTFFNDDASGARQVEGGTIPKTETSLQTGPVGIGLASLAWPGPLAANAGTLALVLQPGLPQDVNRANYPVRAEARTGQDPPETTYDQLPGTTLKSRATSEEVTSDAQVQNATGDDATFGPTQSHSASRLTDAGGQVETSSLVEDINLGGVIKVKSVRSTATATTDGTKSDGEAETIVTGMTVGGQPVTVDEKGVTFAEQGQPANAIANQIAKQALAEGGFEIYMSAPQKEVQGATASVTSGSLIITQKSESGVSGIIIGQAQASVTGAPGFDTGDLGGTDLGGGSFDPGPTDTGIDTGGALDVPAPTVEAPEVPAESAPTEVALQPAADVGGRPVTGAAVLLGMMGAGLFAIGMRRLSDHVLAERAAAAACTLAGEGR